METKKGKLFIEIGPTAVGKNTVLNATAEKVADIIQMPSATTRAPREGEIRGVTKIFLTNEEFDRYIQEDQFVEWQVIHGNRYGVLKKIVQERIDAGNDYLVEVEVLGAMKLKSCYESSAVLTFIIPPSMDELERRIRGRAAETEEEIIIRLNRCKSEVTFIPLCHYVLMNDDLETAVHEYTEIINAERAGVPLVDKRAVTMTVSLIITDAERTKIYIPDQSNTFPSFTAEKGMFPHEQIEKFFQSNDVKAEVLRDRNFKAALNKGLEMPQPVWVTFHKNNNKVAVNYLYAVQVETCPKGYKAISKETLFVPDFILPISPVILQRELNNYL